MEEINHTPSSGPRNKHKKGDSIIDIQVSSLKTMISSLPSPGQTSPGLPSQIAQFQSSVEEVNLWLDATGVALSALDEEPDALDDLDGVRELELSVARFAPKIENLKEQGESILSYLRSINSNLSSLSTEVEIAESCNTLTEQWDKIRKQLVRTRKSVEIVREYHAETEKLTRELDGDVTRAISSGSTPATLMDTFEKRLAMLENRWKQKAPPKDQRLKESVESRWRAIRNSLNTARESNARKQDTFTAVAAQLSSLLDTLNSVSLKCLAVSRGREEGDFKTVYADLQAKRKHYTPAVGKLLQLLASNIMKENKPANEDSKEDGTWDGMGRYVEVEQRWEKVQEMMWEVDAEKQRQEEISQESQGSPENLVEFPELRLTLPSPSRSPLPPNAHYKRSPSPGAAPAYGNRPTSPAVYATQNNNIQQVYNRRAASPLFFDQQQQQPPQQAVLRRAPSPSVEYLQQQQQSIGTTVRRNPGISMIPQPSPVLTHVKSPPTLLPIPNEASKSRPMTPSGSLSRPMSPNTAATGTRNTNNLNTATATVKRVTRPQTANAAINERSKDLSTKGTASTRAKAAAAVEKRQTAAAAAGLNASMAKRATATTTTIRRRASMEIGATKTTQQKRTVNATNKTTAPRATAVTRTTSAPETTTMKEKKANLLRQHQQHQHQQQQQMHQQYHHQQHVPQQRPVTSYTYVQDPYDYQDAYGNTSETYYDDGDLIYYDENQQDMYYVEPQQAYYGYEGGGDMFITSDGYAIRADEIYVDNDGYYYYEQPQYQNVPMSRLPRPGSSAAVGARRAQPSNRPGSSMAMINRPSTAATVAVGPRSVSSMGRYQMTPVSSPPTRVVGAHSPRPGSRMGSEDSFTSSGSMLNPNRNGGSGNPRQLQQTISEHEQSPFLQRSTSIGGLRTSKSSAGPSLGARDESLSSSSSIDGVNIYRRPSAGISPLSNLGLNNASNNHFYDNNDELEEDEQENEFPKYIPDPTDELDERIAYIVNRSPLTIEVRRISKGRYKFGGKVWYCKLSDPSGAAISNKYSGVSVRVGGGWKEFDRVLLETAVAEVK